MGLCAASTAVDNDAEIRPITTGARAQVKQMNLNFCSILKFCPSVNTTGTFNEILRKRKLPNSSNLAIKK